MRSLVFALFTLFTLLSLSANAAPQAPSHTALRVGDSAPSFTAQGSQNGKDFRFALATALAKGSVVVYFFPSAFTHGCDLEAHTFATQMDKFKAVGASVIGISADSLARLHDFSRDPAFCAGKFPVASDPSGQIASRYGLAITPIKAGLKDVRGQAVEHVLFERATYVIAADGKIVAHFSSAKDGLSPVDHVERALAIVTQLKAQAPQ